MLRIGVLGAARVAVYAMLEPARTVSGCRVTTIAARDQKRAIDYAAVHGIPHVHPSYASLIADAEVDLVYVATPPHTHRELAEAAIRAGKAVLVEKPFAMNGGEAESVFRLACRTGTPVFEAMHSLHHLLFRRVESLVQDGAVGDVVRMEARFDAPIDRTTAEFRWRSELGGGALMDLGVYPLAWCRRLAGEAFEVENASAVLESVDTSFEANLRFSNGIEAIVGGSLFGERHQATLSIEGSSGKIEVDNFLAPQRGHRLSIYRSGECEVESVGGLSTYQAQLEAVRDAIVAGAPFPLPPDDYVKSMRAIDKVRSSWAPLS